LANAPLKVQEFHQRYPEKPKPYRGWNFTKTLLVQVYKIEF
jgi:hypothetical protein